MGEDRFLLADVGGTNTRFAIGTRDGLVADTITRFRNDEYDQFTLVLQAFLEQHAGQRFRSAALAIAGPVAADTAQLTNRDWTMDRHALADVIGCDSLRFVNDLGGLARAIPTLQDDQKSALKQGSIARQNGQALVIGLGTGVNASVLFANTALEAEVGHTTATVQMTDLLIRGLGQVPKDMETIEDILSGRGLEAMYTAVTGHRKAAAEICRTAADGTDPNADSICSLYGKLLAELIRELALHYLPRDGIYLSGSVARGVLETAAKQQVIGCLDQDCKMADTLSTLPLWLITDDAAALLGCLEIAKADA